MKDKSGIEAVYVCVCVCEAVGSCTESTKITQRCNCNIAYRHCTHAGYQVTTKYTHVLPLMALAFPLSKSAKA